jgi:hypothetical protein
MVTMVPVKVNGNGITYCKGRFLDFMENVLLFILYRIEERTPPDSTPIAALPTAFGVADGAVQNHTFLSNGEDLCLQGLEVGLFVINSKGIHG